MNKLTADEIEEIMERCYYAGWGYDGQGGIGPRASYQSYQAEQRRSIAMSISSRYPNELFQAQRDHHKGHGWKANHVD